MPFANTGDFRMYYFHLGQFRHSPTSRLRLISILEVFYDSAMIRSFSNHSPLPLTSRHLLPSSSSRARPRFAAGSPPVRRLNSRTFLTTSNYKLAWRGSVRNPAPRSYLRDPTPSSLRAVRVRLRPNAIFPSFKSVPDPTPSSHPFVFAP